MDPKETASITKQRMDTVSSYILFRSEFLSLFINICKDAVIAADFSADCARAVLLTKNLAPFSWVSSEKQIVQADTDQKGILSNYSSTECGPEIRTGILRSLPLTFFDLVTRLILCLGWSLSDAQASNVHMDRQLTRELTVSAPIKKKNLSSNCYCTVPLTVQISLKCPSETISSQNSSIPPCRISIKQHFC